MSSFTQLHGPLLMHSRWSITHRQSGSQPSNRRAMPSCPLVKNVHVVRWLRSVTDEVKIHGQEVILAIIWCIYVNSANQRKFPRPESGIDN
mmetsp:Transcript_62757/g.194792  ORF Transcript_62757/g.194792 Transcript_62757/m.194792 type:complete len:91 (+) Transcript_62757:67-339(+)